MTHKRRLWRCLTVVLMVALLWAMCLSVNAATTSGRCGTRLYWAFDADTGTLSFTGTGAMFSYANQDTPWLTYADQIQTVTFESGITTISDRAFYGCCKLQNITLPDTVNTVGESAFEGCVALKNLPLGAGCSTVGDYAFSGCVSLEEIILPEGVVTLGKGVFNRCGNVKSISIPASLVTIGTGALRGCAVQEITVAADSSTFILSGNCLVTTDGVLLMAGTLGQIPDDGTVHTIGAEAFRGFTGLTAIRIPDSVTTIEDYAFLGCTGLTQVELGTGLEKLGVGAFQGCTALTAVELPQSVTHIGACAFSGCKGLQQVNFPQNLESLGSWAFAHTAITQVSLSNKLSSVGINPFRGCNALTSITVNYRNRSYKAIDNCLIQSSDKILISGCKNATISGVVTVGAEAFRDINIESLSIPDSVQTIEANAFTNSGLKEISFGAGLTQLCGNPLAGCQQLVSISVSNTNTTYRSSGNCLLLSSTLVAGCGASVLEEGITVIGPEAFRETAVCQIILPEGITQIGKRAFFGCDALVTAQLPQSLTQIDESAFERSNLHYLHLEELPTIGSYAFLGCYNLKTVYTPNAAMLNPGSAERGYIAYYVENLTDTQPAIIKHYSQDQLEAVYPSLQAAIDGCRNGWLQLGSHVEESVTLSRDLYIDLAGYDLSGTMDTAGYSLYGMDSTTNSYTCQAVGQFTCKAPDGTAIVPQRQFHTEVTGNALRYMAIAGDEGYTFHRFYIGLTHQTLNITTVGVGYKALFLGDEKVLSQLDPQAAFSYELCLEGHDPIYRSIPLEKLGDCVTLRIENYQVTKYGETPLTARVSLQLADGTQIFGSAHSLTLRSLTEKIDKQAQSLSADQVQALLDMMEAYPIMKTWDVSQLLDMAP